MAAASSSSAQFHKQREQIIARFRAIIWSMPKSRKGVAAEYVADARDIINDVLMNDAWLLNQVIVEAAAASARVLLEKAKAVDYAQQQQNITSRRDRYTTTNHAHHAPKNRTRGTEHFQRGGSSKTRSAKSRRNTAA